MVWQEISLFFFVFVFLIGISIINAYFSSLITKVSFLYRVRGRKTNHAITTIFHGLINLFHDSAIFACALALMDKSNVTWFLRRANWSSLFVLSKRDDDFILEKRTVRVSDNSTSVLLAVRTSTDATAFRQETMITPTHNLPLPSFFIVWCID